MRDWLRKVETVQDFPKQGVVFRDLFSVFRDPKTHADLISHLKETVESLATDDKGKKIKIDFISSPESRGFLLGTTLARDLNVGFIPIRKTGKMPNSTKLDYGTEYNDSNTLEIQKHDCLKGKHVVIVDDLAATCGTALTCAKLVEMTGAKVAGFIFVIELKDLKGREKLNGYKIRSLLILNKDEEILSPMEFVVPEDGRSKEIQVNE